MVSRSWDGLSQTQTQLTVPAPRARSCCATRGRGATLPRSPPTGRVGRGSASSSCRRSSDPLLYYDDHHHRILPPLSADTYLYSARCSSRLKGKGREAGATPRLRRTDTPRPTPPHPEPRKLARLWGGLGMLRAEGRGVGLHVTWKEKGDAMGHVKRQRGLLGANSPTDSLILTQA